MSRLLCRFSALVAALALVLAMAPSAQAQEPGIDANGDGAADVSIDRDPIGAGVHFVEVDAQPNAAGDTGAGNVGGTGGGDVGLAHTGAETEAVMAISIGLLALGGSVLVTSRRRLGALD